MTYVVKVQPRLVLTLSTPSNSISVLSSVLEETFVGRFRYVTTSSLCQVPSCFYQNVFKGLNRRSFCNFNQDLELVRVEKWPNTAFS